MEKKPVINSGLYRAPQKKNYIWGTKSSRVPFFMHESHCSHLSLFIFTKQVNTIGLIEKRWFVNFKMQKCKFSRVTRLDPNICDDKNMACVRRPGCSHHVDDIVHLRVCSSERRPFHLCFHTVSCMKRFIPPLLSVHACLCKAVVHDAEGSHPSWEPILTRTGAGLTRMPNGHLRELLLHNRQVDLQAWKRHKQVNRGENALIVECNNARVPGRSDFIAADSVSPLLWCLQLTE